MSAEDYGDRVTRFGAAMSQRFRNSDMRPDVGEFPRKYLRRARRRYRQTAGAGYADSGLSHEPVSAAWMSIVVVVSKFDVVPSETVPPLPHLVVLMVTERFPKSSCTELTAYKQPRSMET